jgi:hypothetical protein
MSDVYIKIQASGGVAPVGATLMKTGQTTVYRTGDDADTSAEGRATDFFTLAVNNPFGNTDRFTDELGGTTYTNNIVIDWSTYDTVAGTVLGYHRRLVSSGGVFDFNWNDAIDLALAFSVGTFTSGWRLWNRTEANNIMNLEYANAFDYAPFGNPSGQLVGQDLWTSSTLKISTTQAWYTRFYGQWAYVAKTNTKRVIAVRTFTVTGTTLS